MWILFHGAKRIAVIPRKRAVAEGQTLDASELTCRTIQDPYTARRVSCQAPGVKTGDSEGDGLPAAKPVEQDNIAIDGHVEHAVIAHGQVSGDSADSRFVNGN